MSVTEQFTIAPGPSDPRDAGQEALRASMETTPDRLSPTDPLHRFGWIYATAARVLWPFGWTYLLLLGYAVVAIVGLVILAYFGLIFTAMGAAFSLGSNSGDTGPAAMLGILFLVTMMILTGLAM
ncbi:MAG: hypothetical protein ABI743_08915, partial [bacterium]